jgi:outer membrane receptor protein involved in Fe transport
VVQLTAFYNVNGEDGNLKLYLQVNNALDKTYAEAVWYGDTANYAPAAERNIGVGIMVKW